MVTKATSVPNSEVSIRYAEGITDVFRTRLTTEVSVSDFLELLENET